VTDANFITLATAGALHLIGTLHVVHALMNVRSSQSTVAWVISLITFPYVAIPLYWFFGRDRYRGYVQGRRSGDAGLRRSSIKAIDHLSAFETAPDTSLLKASARLANLPLLRGNSSKLLIDAEQAFPHFYELINDAEKYLLVIFFIIKNDVTGKEFQQALIKKARQGVRVCLMYDSIGTHKLSRKYLKELQQAGVECRFFGANRHWWTRFQINFRNHRKIIIADGRRACLGGLNIGDEYRGMKKHLSPWRDTNIALEGPCVQALQLTFLEDWSWADGTKLDLEWAPQRHPADERVLILPTGPADTFDSWLLFVAQVANSAVKRLWIATPYFVPDDGTLTALQTAALRGVDVRILLPFRPDHRFVWLSGKSYYEQTLPIGIRIFRTNKGFLHQKVILMDDEIATVGTANIDNRSFRLNFEVTAVLPDRAQVAAVDEMLTRDFDQSREVALEEYTHRAFLYRATCRLARLFAPVQ